MLRILLVLAAVLLAACESVCVDCRCSDSTIRGQWILDCVKNGNNMSDEEMEDVIRQCIHASESLFCGRARCRRQLLIADTRAEWLEEPECGKLKMDIRVDSLRSVAEDIKKCGGNADADK